MTFAEAITQGYRTADMQYQKGYVRRSTNIDEQIVHTAGGSRKGELYVLVPSYCSSRFCIRQYLRKP